MAANAVRAAKITGTVGPVEREQIDRYLPSNYSTVVVEAYGPRDGDNGLRIVGIDVAGWTLDDYVIPRLASGCIYAEEVGA